MTSISESGQRCIAPFGDPGDKPNSVRLGQFVSWSESFDAVGLGDGLCPHNPRG